MNNELLIKLSDVYMYNNCETIKDSDIVQLLGELCINRVAGIAYSNMLKGIEVYAPKDFMNTLKAVWNDNLEKTKCFINDLKYLSGIFKDCDQPYAFLKGSFLTTQVYEKGFRTSNDFDVLINEDNVSNFQNMLFKCGFVQGRVSYSKGIIPANRREIINSKVNYGETIPFVKLIDSRPLVVDLNISVEYKPEAERSIVDKLLSETVEYKIDDVLFKSLTVENNFIHLCCHLYKEATTIQWVKRKRDLQLYKFSDINVMLHEFMKEEFAISLLKKIKEFGVEKECYYAIVNTSELYPSVKLLDGLNTLIELLTPANLGFMKQVIDPINNRVLKYNMDFLDWFRCKDRISSLIDITKHNYD